MAWNYHLFLFDILILQGSDQSPILIENLLKGFLLNQVGDRKIYQRLLSLHLKVFVWIWHDWFYRINCQHSRLLRLAYLLQFSQSFHLVIICHWFKKLNWNEYQTWIISSERPPNLEKFNNWPCVTKSDMKFCPPNWVESPALLASTGLAVCVSNWCGAKRRLADLVWSYFVSAPSVP